VLLEPGQETLPNFLAERKVHVIASLPSPWDPGTLGLWVGYLGALGAWKAWNILGIYWVPIGWRSFPWWNFMEGYEVTGLRQVIW